MDFLGVGPLELVFILLVVFLVIGPNDLAATGKKLGRFLSTVKKSEFWGGVSKISKEMRSLPTTLMREAELEDFQKEMKQDMNSIGNLSKEFDVDVPEWRKSARKDLSTASNAAKQSDAETPVAPPLVQEPETEPQPKPAPESEAKPLPESAPKPQPTTAPKAETKPQPKPAPESAPTPHTEEGNE